MRCERALAAAEESRRVTTNPDVSPLPHPTAATAGPVAFAAATAAATPEQRAELVSVVTGAAASARHQLVRRAEHDDTRRRRSSPAPACAVLRPRHRRALSPSRAATTAAATRRVIPPTSARSTSTVSPPRSSTPASATRARRRSIPATTRWCSRRTRSPTCSSTSRGSGFSALATQEHRSFMRMDERLMSDARHDPRRRARRPRSSRSRSTTRACRRDALTLIDRGVCAASSTTRRPRCDDGVASTGHSLPQPNTWGPLPRHVVMDAGDTPWEEMVRVGVAWAVHHAVLVRARRASAAHGDHRDDPRGNVPHRGRPDHAARSRTCASRRASSTRSPNVVQVSRERRLELGEGESGVLSPWLHISRFTFSS